MTHMENAGIDVADRLPALDLPLEGERTLSLRSPRRSALLSFFPHRETGLAEPGLAECGGCRSFLEDLADASDAIHRLGGEIALVTAEEAREALEKRAREAFGKGAREALENVPVATDPGGKLGAHLHAGADEARLFLADRYGEVYAAWSAAEVEEGHEALPSPSELVEWVTFLATQCPECGVLDTADRTWRTI